jgi:hypothetical protein
MVVNVRTTPKITTAVQQPKPSELTGAAAPSREEIAPVIPDKDAFKAQAHMPSASMGGASQAGQFLPSGGGGLYGAGAAKEVDPSPIAGVHSEHWDEPVSIIFDAALGVLGQNKADLKQALTEIMARQRDGGGWPETNGDKKGASISTLNHTALTAALKSGVFADDPKMHAKLESALASSWVNVHGGYDHKNINGKFLDPLPSGFLKHAHPVAQAFHAASREQTLDGQSIPQKVLDAAKLFNAAARADLTLDKTVRPLQVSAAMTTLLGVASHLSPHVLALAGKTVMGGLAVATPGLNFVAGLVLAHMAASYSESFFHDRMLHATPDMLELAKKLGPVGDAIIASHFSHKKVHHDMTFNPDYTKQFKSEEDKETLRALLLELGKQEIIDEQFGASMSWKDFVKFVATIAPAIAVVGVTMGPVALAGAGVSAVAFPLMSKTVHPYLHKTEEELVLAPPFIKWFISTPIGKHISRQHYVHHIRNGGDSVNFNLFGWFGDWVRGRYDLPLADETASLRKAGVVG